MPLSEQEQRLLEEMERSLYHNDADFVATVSVHGGKRNYTTILIGILVGLLGVAAIVTGVVIRLPIVGIIGFVVMFVGVLLSISTPRRPKPGDAGYSDGSGGGEPGTATPAKNATRPDFMDRLNERWEKRQDEHDQ